MNKTETYEHLFVGKGRVTLAIVVDGETVKVGMAFCSPKDQFVKIRGRQIARGRALAGSFNSFEFKSVGGLVENKRQAFDEFMTISSNNDGSIPCWAVKSIAVGDFATIQDIRMMSEACKDGQFGVLL